MAYGNWDDCLQEYESCEELQRAEFNPLILEIKINARKMVKLIPQMRNLPEVKDFIPVTSHSCLHLDHPLTRQKVSILFQKGEYQITRYIVHGNMPPYATTLAEARVSETEVISKFSEYLRAAQFQLEVTFPTKIG